LDRSRWDRLRLKDATESYVREDARTFLIASGSRTIAHTTASPRMTSVETVIAVRRPFFSSDRPETLTVDDECYKWLTNDTGVILRCLSHERKDRRPFVTRM
jgi:hypothetical protein